jgi:hypothetical protein
METLGCDNKLRGAGITKSAAENLCNQQAYRLNENATAKEILCAIKHGNKACSEMKEYQVD